MTGFSFAPPRPARRPSLTPMIDVVFLLLVFFMLAARFGSETSLRMSPPAQGAAMTWDGPPRLITLRPDGLLLNGTPVLATDLARALSPLMQTPADPIVVRPAQGAQMQGLIDLLETLERSGFSAAFVVE